MDHRSSNARWLTIWLTLMSTTVVFALLPFSKISFSLTKMEGLAYLFAIFLAFSIYCWKRGLVRLAPALEAVALGLFLTVPVLVSTYLAMSLDMPLTDDLLIKADEALGFDWHSFVAFVDARPLLAEALAYAYRSFPIQLLILPLLLGAFGRYDRTYEMILSYGVICYLSSIIAIWFPALGAYAMHGIEQDHLRNIGTYYGYEFLADFNAIRENSTFDLSIQSASGILTFPSVHAAVALLCAWAAWPVKPLRYVFAGLNILMSISAVSHGSHYMVDILAGFAVATASICAVRYALDWMSRRTWHLRQPVPIGTGARADNLVE